MLSFFTSPDSDDECLSDDARRTGLCLNTYECRIQGIVDVAVIIMIVFMHF